MDAAQDRTELWLSLLPQLTEEFPRWAVWKNVESAFAGTGDVDSFAPREDWSDIQRRFTTWAGEQGLGPVIVCRHIPQGPHFIALQEGSPYLVQLDVKDRGTFRGSTLIDAEDLQRLSELDDRGFRRARPGVEGVIKLCMNGTHRGGKPNRAGLRAKRVPGLLAADPDGAAMRQVDAWCLVRSVAEPGVAASRLWFLYWAAERCLVVSLIRDHDRRVPESRGAWLAEVSRDHEVLHVG